MRGTCSALVDRAVAAKALQDTIDNALADTQFKRAMALSPG
jgi:hypothetical protein